MTERRDYKKKQNNLFFWSIIAFVAFLSVYSFEQFSQQKQTNSSEPGYASTSYGCTTTPTLMKGSTGKCVKRLQSLLGVSADGIFGPKTSAAVKKFQKRKNLAVDGIVGKKTWKALLK